MKKLFLTVLLVLILTGCTTTTVHDSKIHRECSSGQENIKSSVKKHIECMDEKSKEQAGEPNL